jgi:hypothetical protein
MMGSANRGYLLGHGTILIIIMTGHISSWRILRFYGVRTRVDRRVWRDRKIIDGIFVMGLNFRERRRIYLVLLAKLNQVRIRWVREIRLARDELDEILRDCS